MYPIYLAGPITGSRAYTDPISNATANTTVNPLAIRNDLAAGGLSPEFLNVVLHETTHYSSFLLPVGYVLGAMLAAHTANPIGLIEDQDKVEGPARIVIQATVLERYFTPLLEGLALFSEFDAAPGDSPVASTVSSVGLNLFCKRAIVFEALGLTRSSYEILAHYIHTHRIKQDAVQRKTALLGEPLASDNGYLLGYLWVKALWRVLIGKCHKLFDTDLFISFVMDYFFADFNLCSLAFNWLDAMKSSGDLESYVEDIEYYIFGERLGQLVANVSEYVDQYEHYATQHAPGHIFMPGETRSFPSYHNFTPAAEENITMSLALGSVRSMHFMWPEFLRGRHILRLFVAPAEAEIAEDGMFRATLLDHEGYLEGAAIEIARPVSKKRVTGQGSVEAVLLTREMRVIYCVFLGHELIATVDVVTGDVNDPQAVEACDSLSSYLSLEAAAVQIAEESYFRDGSRAAQLTSRLLSRAKCKAYEYYSNLGLGTDDGRKQDREVLRILDEGGIVMLLEQYPGHIEWLVRLSLSAGGRVVTFDEAASHWGVNAKDIENWLTRLNATIVERCGKEAFALDNNAFGLCQF